MKIETLRMGSELAVRVLSDQALRREDWPQVDSVLGDPLALVGYGECVDFVVNPMEVIGDIDGSDHDEHYPYEMWWIYPSEGSA